MSLNEKSDFIQPQKSDGERQAQEFLKANFFASEDNQYHACQRFEYLANDKSFALNRLAWIRSLDICNYAQIKYRKIWDLKKNDLPSWLQEEYINTSLNISKRLKLKKYHAQFLAKSIRYKKVKKIKLELLKRSLSIAKESKDKKIIKKLTKKLYKFAPRLRKKITSAYRFKAGHDFEKAREFDKARVFYRKIIRDPKANINTKKMSWNRLRLSYKQQRQKPTYVHKTKKMVSFFKKKLINNPKSSRLKKIWVNTSIKYARALWTLHQRDEGRDVLMKLLVYGVNNTDSLKQIHWILGNMKAEEKKFLDAIDQFSIAAELKSSNKSLHEKITWALGWNHFLLNNFDKTIEIFTAFIEHNDSHGFNNKLKFWIAKSFVALDKKSKANRLYRELVRTDSYGYYGIISHMELDLPLNPIKLKKNNDYHEDITLEWLIAMDEKKLTHSYLKSIQSKFKTTEQIVDLLPLYERVGWYEGGIFKFFRIKAKDRVDVIQDHVTSAFPIPYKDLAKKAAAIYKISPELIFSITRQESAFNPVIRSWADAFGLMQLTPERATELASRYDIQYKSVEDLFDPYTNIQLGAALLGELKHKFKNNFIHYVASYNASESVVKNWFRRHWSGDPLKFIEMIPYEETQGYVKLVFRNLISYKRLLEEDSFHVNPEMFTDF